MSTWDRSQLRPQYPEYNEKGIDLLPQEFGPIDTWPSGLGPGYPVYASAHGRNLAGMDSSNFDRKNAEGIETYPNELNALSVSDDIVGNGVFDPNDTHGNIHPEDGIFQDHQSLPGYIDRDKFYAKSEVRDLTQPNAYTVYVPGGAVSFQEGQEETFNKNQLLWEVPPQMTPVQFDYPELDSTVNAPTATWAVRGIGADEAKSEDDKKAQYYALAAGAGLAIGLAFIMMNKKKGRR